MQNSDDKDKPELFFGLVGATGTELEKVMSALESSLSCVGYVTKPITLSDYFPRKKFGIKDVFRNDYYKIYNLQTAGDMYRERYCDGGATALLAVFEIRKHRENSFSLLSMVNCEEPSL